MKKNIKKVKKEELEEVDIDKKLEDLFPEKKASDGERFAETEAFEIEVDKIDIPKDALRTAPDDEVDELAASIESVGLLQPIIISKAGTLVGGHRRLLACMRLKRKTIKANVVELNANDQYLARGIENLQRMNLSAAEEGRFYFTLLKDKGRFPTQKSLAEALGVREARITLALQAIGEGRKYSGVNKEKKKAQEEAAAKIPKEKMRRFSKDNTPPNVEAVTSKHKLIISFTLKIENEQHAKDFDIKKEIAKALDEVVPRDFAQEMQIIREDL